jgi:hypothetical protein
VTGQARPQLDRARRDSAETCLDAQVTSQAPPPRANLFGAIPLAAGLAAGVLLLPWLIRLSPLHGTLCLLQAGIAAAGIARAAFPVLRPVAVVTFVFTFSWLGLAPTYQLATGTAAWRDSAVLRSPFVTPALILLVLATATLYLGFFRHGQESPRRQRARTTSVDPPRSICLAYVAACCGLAPMAISASGGLSNMFSSRTQRADALGTHGLVLADVGGLGIALVSVLPGALATAGTYLVLIRVLNQSRAAGWREVKAADAALLSAALGLAIIFTNPFVNTRALSAAALGSLALLMLRPRSGRAGALMAVGLIFATLVVYPAAGAFGAPDQARSSHGLEFLASQDFDGFQQTINAVRLVDDLGHSFGSYTASGVLYFVPRDVWQSKESPASIDVATHRGYSFTNLSLPIQAELFVDFGIVGMAVALFLFASAGRRCDLLWAAGAGLRMAWIAPYASMACLSIIRGPIGANGPVYLTNLALITVGLLFARVSTDRSSGTP